MEFFRFPRTPHLAWLGEGKPRDDKVLSPDEAKSFFENEILVEEKIDGANVGVFVDEKGIVQAQNRGTLLTTANRHPQFKSLFGWLAVHRDAFLTRLPPDLMLFGEWCYAVHSIFYSRLPDWFLAFDVYDRKEKAFLCTSRRDDLIRLIGLELVPKIADGRFDLGSLKQLLGPSRFGDGPAEGLYLRRDAGNWLGARAKLVRPEFAQAMGQHWSHRSLKTNSLGYLNNPGP